MPIPSTGTALQPSVAKLVSNVGYLCRRIARGKKAAENLSVRWHLALRIASILLTSLGSVGVIADQTARNLPNQSGLAFWGSVVLLVFGILSQIANEFQISQLAADSISLAEKCEVFDTRLENVLNNDDPRTDVSTLLVEVNTLFESERYNRVLPRRSQELEMEATNRASFLVNQAQANWQLAVRRQKGVVAPRSPEPSPEDDGLEQPPDKLTGDESHG